MKFGFLPFAGVCHGSKKSNFISVLFGQYSVMSTSWTPWNERNVYEFRPSPIFVLKKDSAGLRLHPGLHLRLLSVQLWRKVEESWALL